MVNRLRNDLHSSSAIGMAPIIRKPPIKPPPTTTRPEQRIRDVPQQLNSATASQAQFEQPSRFSHQWPTSDKNSTSKHHRNARITEVRCAWCIEERRNHNHDMLNCVMFKNAHVKDQWRVVNKQRICPLCLADFHLVSNCPQKKTRRQKLSGLWIHSPRPITLLSIGTQKQRKKSCSDIHSSYLPSSPQTQPSTIL